MHKSQLEKARDILSQKRNPAHLYKELEDCLGTIVTLYSGRSIHVGTFRRITEPRAITQWEVAYYKAPYHSSIQVKFDTRRVAKVDWDPTFDRPSIYIQP